MTPIEQLRLAQQRDKEIYDAFRAGQLYGEEWRLRSIAVSRELLAAERLVAAEEGVPHAIEWQPNGRWPAMLEGAVMLAGSFIAVLTFDSRGYARKSDDADGATQVVFKQPDGVRYSDVNDEVIDGHPLYGKGLDAYGLFEVANSPWIDEIRQSNAVHSMYDPSHWSAVSHYLFCFKDRMHEVMTKYEPTWKSFATRSEALQHAVLLCEAPSNAARELLEKSAGSAF